MNSFKVVNESVQDHLKNWYEIDLSVSLIIYLKKN